MDWIPEENIEAFRAQHEKWIKECGPEYEQWMFESLKEKFDGTRKA